MPESPNPAFVVIDYHSVRGPHKMQIGLTGITNIGASADLLQATAWDASSPLILDMVTDLVTEIVPRYPATAAFDSCSIFSQPDPEDLPLFVGAFSISSIGTAATPGWFDATQESINMRDSLGFMAKLSLMDFASGNDFGKYLNPVTIGVDGIFDQLSASSNAWMSRAGNQISSFISRTATLNEKLRRAYRLA